MAQKMWFFKGDSLEEMTRTGSLRGLAQSIDVSKGSRNCPTDNDLNMDPILRTMVLEYLPTKLGDFGQGQMLGFIFQHHGSHMGMGGERRGGRKLQRCLNLLDMQ